MDRPRLTDAIDPADPLFETDRIPWQFEIDDQAAMALKIQPLGACIRGDHHVGGPGRERAHRLPPFLRRLSTMKGGDLADAANRVVYRVECVAILGEDDERARARAGPFAPARTSSARRSARPSLR